jgi:hypothetical protein
VKVAAYQLGCKSIRLNWGLGVYAMQSILYKGKVLTR